MVSLAWLVVAFQAVVAFADQNVGECDSVETFEEDSYLQAVKKTNHMGTPAFHQPVVPAFNCSSCAKWENILLGSSCTNTECLADSAKRVANKSKHDGTLPNIQDMIVDKVRGSVEWQTCLSECDGKAIVEQFMTKQLMSTMLADQSMSKNQAASLLTRRATSQAANSEIANSEMVNSETTVSEAATLDMVMTKKVDTDLKNKEVVIGIQIRGGRNRKYKCLGCQNCDGKAGHSHTSVWEFESEGDCSTQGNIPGRPFIRDVPHQCVLFFDGLHYKHKSSGYFLDAVNHNNELPGCFHAQFVPQIRGRSSDWERVTWSNNGQRGDTGIQSYDHGHARGWVGSSERGSKTAVCPSSRGRYFTKMQTFGIHHHDGCR